MMRATHGSPRVNVSIATNMDEPEEDGSEINGWSGNEEADYLVQTYGCPRLRIISSLQNPLALGFKSCFGFSFINSLGVGFKIPYVNRIKVFTRFRFSI